MSWSVSAGAPRDEALKQIRAQLNGMTYLPAGERARAEHILDTIDGFAFHNVDPGDTLSVSAWGSESITSGGTGEPPRITAIQGGYNVTATRPVVADSLAQATATVDAPTAG